MRGAGKEPQALKFLGNFVYREAIRLLTFPKASAITRLHLDRGRSSGVEHNLAKVRVGRSIRLARSRFYKGFASRAPNAGLLSPRSHK